MPRKSVRRKSVRRKSVRRKSVRRKYSRKKVNTRKYKKRTYKRRTYRNRSKRKGGAPGQPSARESEKTEENWLVEKPGSILRKFSQVGPQFIMTGKRNVTVPGGDENKYYWDTDASADLHDANDNRVTPHYPVSTVQNWNQQWLDTELTKGVVPTPVVGELTKEVVPTPVVGERGQYSVTFTDHTNVHTIAKRTDDRAFIKGAFKAALDPPWSNFRCTEFVEVPSATRKKVTAYKIEFYYGRGNINHFWIRWSDMKNIYGPQQRTDPTQKFMKTFEEIKTGLIDTSEKRKKKLTVWWGKLGSDGEIGENQDSPMRVILIVNDQRTNLWELVNLWVQTRPIPHSVSKEYRSDFNKLFSIYTNNPKYKIHMELKVKEKKLPSIEDYAWLILKGGIDEGDIPGIIKKAERNRSKFISEQFISESSTISREVDAAKAYDRQGHEEGLDLKGEYLDESARLWKLAEGAHV
jgi:hypothetical protein